jgi:hypothetical protein
MPVIDDHRAAYGVEPICRVLPIAPSTYHAHAARRADPDRASARAKSDAELCRNIQRVENFQVYGVRKVWRQLKREGIAVALVQRDQRGRSGPIRSGRLRDTGGVRASGIDHAVEDGDANGGLDLLAGQLSGIQAVAEDALVARHGGFRLGPPAIVGFPLPAQSGSVAKFCPRQSYREFRPFSGGNVE